MSRPVLIGLFAVTVVCGSADARQQHPVDATPFAHAPCSVLDGRPCTSSFCSVFNHGPCIPEIDYPAGQNLQVTVESLPSPDDAAKYQKPDHDLNTLQDLFAALRTCWSPPPLDQAHEGMQMSVRFSFKRSGDIIAAPRVTYASRDASSDTRETYRRAIFESLDHCAPLPFSNGLGGAIAGRPIMIRYIDNRKIESQK
jgi:hypothetical protein